MTVLQPVLMLNATYEPIALVTLRRAMTLVLNGNAVVELPSGRSIRTSRMSLPAPSVIRLKDYRRVPRQTRALSRKNILARDRNTCQYCGAVFHPAQLTLDHVIPRARSGDSVWENLVAACRPCNHRKGSRSPEEAGMKLARLPRPFTLHTSRHLLRLSGETEKAWQPYLFYSTP